MFSKKLFNNNQNSSGGGSGGPTNWGSIGGDIDNQTDLKGQLNDKADRSELQQITQELNTKADVSQLNDKADRSELPTIATINNVGLVKPDGTTITITSEGVISSSGDTTIPITSLTYAETINLEVDKVYKLVATGNVTFVLPTVENPTTLSQILIQFKMANPVTINLGTTNYFKKTAPTMTTAGMYDIVYEYDALNSCWVVDAVIKGPVS